MVPRTARLTRPSRGPDRFIYSDGQGFDHSLEGQKFQPSIPCSVLRERLGLYSDRQRAGAVAEFGHVGPKVDSCIHRSGEPRE